MKALLWYAVPIICLLAIGGYSGYIYWQTLQATRQQNLQDQKVAAEALAGHVQLARILAQLNISSQDMTDGFWFSYQNATGTDNVLFADTNALAVQHMSNEQLQALANHLASSTIISRDDITEVQSSGLPLELQFHNQLYAAIASGAASTSSIMQTLRQKLAAATTSEALFELSYFDDIYGNYKERNYLNKENCRLYRARCETQFTVTLKGRVSKSGGGPPAGIVVSVASRPDIRATTTDARGDFMLKFKTNTMESLHVRAHARTFADDYADVYILAIPSQAPYTLNTLRMQPNAAPANADQIDTNTQCIQIIEGNGACGDGSWGPWITESQSTNGGIITSVQQRAYVGTRAVSAELPTIHIQYQCGPYVPQDLGDDIITPYTACELIQTRTVATGTPPSLSHRPQPASATLIATPPRITSGNPTTLAWRTTGAQSCTVSGTNGDTWTSLSSPRGGQVTSPILSDTLFTLSCLAPDGTAQFATTTTTISNEP